MWESSKPSNCQAKVHCCGEVLVFPCVYLNAFCVACFCISKDEHFDAPFCGFVFHVLLE